MALHAHLADAVCAHTALRVDIFELHRIAPGRTTFRHAQAANTVSWHAVREVTEFAAPAICNSGRHGCVLNLRLRSYVLLRYRVLEVANEHLFNVGKPE